MQIYTHIHYWFFYSGELQSMRVTWSSLLWHLAQIIPLLACCPLGVWVVLANKLPQWRLLPFSLICAPEGLWAAPLLELIVLTTLYLAKSGSRPAAWARYSLESDYQAAMSVSVSKILRQLLEFGNFLLPYAFIHCQSLSSIPFTEVIRLGHGGACLYSHKVETGWRRGLLPRSGVGGVLF